jgi:uncharacterized protein (TIGR02217 family)
MTTFRATQAAVLVAVKAAPRFRATQLAVLAAVRKPATFRATQLAVLVAANTQPATFRLTQAVLLAVVRNTPDFTWGAMFYELIFPEDISFGSEGGPTFNTDVVEVESGFDQRVSRWTEGKNTFNVAYGVRTLEQLGKLIAFNRIVKGRAVGFRYKDWSDYSTAGFTDQDADTVTSLDQSLGTGDGSTKVFQLVKTYSYDDGVNPVKSVNRTITKPRASTLLVAVASTTVSTGAYSLNATNGKITFNVAPANNDAVQAGFEFDVPARFATDELPVRLENYGVGGVTVLVEEIRVE